MGSKTHHLRRQAQRIVDNEIAKGPSGAQFLAFCRQYVFEPAPQARPTRFARPEEYVVTREPPRVRHRVVRGEVQSRTAAMLHQYNAVRAAKVDELVEERRNGGRP